MAYSFNSSIIAWRCVQLLSRLWNHSDFGNDAIICVLVANDWSFCSHRLAIFVISYRCYLSSWAIRISFPLIIYFSEAQRLQLMDHQLFYMVWAFYHLLPEVQDPPSNVGLWILQYCSRKSIAKIKNFQMPLSLIFSESCKYAYYLFKFSQTQFLCLWWLSHRFYSPPKISRKERSLRWLQSLDKAHPHLTLIKWIQLFLTSLSSPTMRVIYVVRWFLAQIKYSYYFDKQSSHFCCFFNIRTEYNRFVIRPMSCSILVILFAKLAS